MGHLAHIIGLEAEEKPSDNEGHVWTFKYCLYVFISVLEQIASRQKYRYWQKREPQTIRIIRGCLSIA